MNIDKPLRTVVYCRLGDYTGIKPDFNLQEKYYREFIDNKPNWIYCGIYIDEPKTHLCSFNSMIEDAKNENFDLIICKSISRFRRNISECIKISDELLKLENPVGIYFESEGLNTLEKETSKLLAMFSSMAIEESKNKGKHISCIFLKGIINGK